MERQTTFNLFERDTNINLRLQWNDQPLQSVSSSVERSEAKDSDESLLGRLYQFTSYPNRLDLSELESRILQQEQRNYAGAMSK